VNSNRMDIRYLLYGYKFVCMDKQYPKEACDVPTHYSTKLSLSLNQNCKTVSSFLISEARISADPDKRFHSIYSLLKGKNHRNSQLDATHDTGSESGCHTDVDNLSLLKAYLYSLPPYLHRRFRFLPPLLTGNQASGASHSSAMSVHEGKRNCQHIWPNRSTTWVNKALDNWCALAMPNQEIHFGLTKTL